MRIAALALAALIACCPPAAAQSITADIDRTLWCASAFYWLAGSAEDAGETGEAETYDRWSKRLLDVGGAALLAAGFQADRVEELIAMYDEAALAQLGTEDAPYEVVTCPELLGEWR